MNGHFLAGQEKKTNSVFLEQAISLPTYSSLRVRFAHALFLVRSFCY